MAEKGWSFTNALFNHRPMSFSVQSQLFRVALLIGVLNLGHAATSTATACPSEGIDPHAGLTFPSQPLKNYQLSTVPTPPAWRGSHLEVGA